MVRSRIGPLALESPLGQRGSTLYRAIHVQQKQQVALQLVSVPLGLTAEAKKRFLEDIERLKTLRHDNIVRCYGGGVDGNDAYVVFDLLHGESLASRVERSGRIPWEIVLNVGLQLCDALQHAHNCGWLHGALSPEKILFEADNESIKLVGFRGEVLKQFMTRPKLPAELAFQPPEQFLAPVTPHPAIDLYALGAVMYYALTGQPPFVAESVEQLKYHVAHDDAAPVATIIFDCPVWLSKIVEQLLSKNPINRPFTAAATGLALREAEKRAMSGASVVEHAVGGFSPLQLNLDKEEAEKALGVRPKKKKRKSSETPVFERPIVLLASLFVVIGLIYYFMQPLSEETLYRRAAKLMANKDKLSYINARDWYLQPMLSRYPDGEYGDWARTQLDVIEMENAEDIMERHERFNQDPSSEGERRYSEARRYERFGDRISALERYRAIVELFKSNEDERPFVNLSLRQIREIETNPPDKEELLAFLNEKLDQADQLFEKGDVVAAKRIWDSILSLYNGNAEMLSVVSRAQGRLDRMRDGSRTEKP